MECSKCGAEYRLQKSDELEQQVRNLCKCEQSRVCGHQKKGKTKCGGVVQALLDLDLQVELYVCETHAAHDCLDEMAPPKPKATRAAKSEIEERKSPMTPEEFSESIRLITHSMTCLACRTAHAFNARVPKVYDKTDKRAFFSTHCPKCDAGEYFPDGPPWRKTYIATENFLNPQPQAPPKTVSRRK